MLTVISSPTTIGGLSTVCAGGTALETDGVTGGSWSSSNTAVATFGSSGGLITGGATGTATITYSLGASCTIEKPITVNGSPAAITGVNTVCQGASTTLSDATTGGTWSSAITSIALVFPAGPGTGIVNTSAPGIETISYTVAGCAATYPVTVYPTPSSISGPAAVCAGLSISLTDAITGGTWTSSNTSIALVDASGNVTGILSGPIIITYSLGGGCSITKTITVNPIAGITGSLGVCVSATTALTDAVSGGTWGSGSTGVASVVPGGTVNGLSVGTSAITYTTSGGCVTTAVVTVNLSPSPIEGTLNVCVGATTLLGNTAGGGTWTIANTAVATVDGFGTVTGVTPGTTGITYSLGGGCSVTKTITVNPIASITGSLGVCVSATTILTDAVSGGTWGSGSTAMASVVPGGIVTGLSVGTSAITYTTPGGCASTAIVTVNLSPSSIEGTLNVCVGATTLLGNTAGGGTWTITNTAVATVGGGTVTGVTPGTTGITYSLGSGCIVSATVTVDAGAAPISGATAVCVASTTALGDATSAGTWSSTATTVASISATGVVRGLTAGTAIIIYTPPSGCAATATITVNPLPAGVTGTTPECAGFTLTLGNATTGGRWSSSNTGIATADSLLGAVTGVAAGTAAINYTLTTGCSSTTTVTINAVPPGITGSMVFCTDGATILYDGMTGGTWNSSNTGIASISLGGIVTSTMTGTATISYTVNGCITSAVVTVDALPGLITGVTVCAGASATISESSTGGTWSSSNSTVATINEGSGVVTGVAGGGAIITYSLGPGCMVTALVAVNPPPLAITGITEVCVGYTTILEDPSGGGLWSSSSTVIATISSMGVVRGISGGPSIISYTSTSTGCAATRLVTVVAVPAISGVSDMCAYSTTGMVSDGITGGTWTSTLATVSMAGVVTPYASGTATLTYTIPLGCYVTASFTIYPLPGPVTGIVRFCRGTTVTVGDITSGGVWSSSNTGVAPVIPIAIGTASVTGLSAGTAIVSYVLPTGCMQTAMMTIDSFPVAGTIFGPASVCAGATIMLSDSSSGGVWSSSNTTASVLSAVVTGVSEGVDTIRYRVSNSCGSIATTATLSVNPLPEAGSVSGSASVCVADSIILTDLVTGGVWSSSNTTVTVAGGIALGIAMGSDTINYAVTNGCGTAVSTKPLTVNALPAVPGSISGLDTLCSGATFALTDITTGGTWSSSNGVISVTAAGLINTLSVGVDTISYSITNMCGTVSVSTTIAVKGVAAPDSISGQATVCEGADDTLAGTPQGGVWSVSNTNATITITPTGAIVTGITAGADTIFYTMLGDCSGAVAILPMTVFAVNQCNERVPSPSMGPGPAGEVLRVWPNPSDGTFSVLLSSDNDEPVHILISNIVGEKVSEITGVTNNAIEVKLNEAVGVYFISASTAMGNYVGKVAVE